jgi:predicted permease
MGMDTSELVVPLVGALQASISVLITIFFGVLTAQFNLLSVGAAKEVSRACVRMFLPALLIYKLGSNLNKDTGILYLPILVWSLSYTLISLGIGVIACRVFKLPNWVKLAVAFNNTTSLPLLLIQSLSTTGVLDAIIPPGDDASKALDRAESYFLINAMVSNSLTFALGPRLLRPSDEDAPDEDDKEDEESDGEEDGMERGPDGIVDEETSLLPHRAVRPINRLERRGYRRTMQWIESLPPWAQQFLGFLYQFANAPLLGTLVGAIIGLTPPLHRLFFSDSNDGGYFNAWLTTAIKNVGSLFATTQIIVVGVKLSQSLRKMKAGEDSGAISKKSMAFVFFMRFFFWPAVTIPLIYALATKTTILSDDPMLWFAMMLMSSGPSAMILVALTDVTGSPEEDKMIIAKFLTVRTPL